MLAAGWISQLVYIYGNAPQWFIAFPIHLYVFALGMAAAVVVSGPWKALRSRADALAARAWVWWVLGVIGLFVLARINHAVRGSSSPNHGLLAAAYASRAASALCFVMPCVFGDQQLGMIRSGLRSRPLVYLGLVSYGIYLWHPLTMQAIQNDWLGWRTGTGNAAGLVAVALPVVVALASVSWFVVERPINRLARRV